MSALLEMRAMRRWPLVLSFMVLPALPACAGGTAAQREDTASPSAVTSSPPPTAAQPPAPAAPPASAPEAPAGALSPASPPGLPEPPPASAPAPTADGKMLPPCVPVRRPKHVAKKHKKTEQTAPQEMPAPPAEPAEAPPNAVVEARVGELDTPLTSILERTSRAPRERISAEWSMCSRMPKDTCVPRSSTSADSSEWGTRRIAVDWPLLRFNPKGDESLILSVSREKLQSAPEYKSNSPRVLMPPAARDATDPDQARH